MGTIKVSIFSWQEKAKTKQWFALDSIEAIVLEHFYLTFYFEILIDSNSVVRSTIESSCTPHLVSPCDNVMYQYSKTSHPRLWHWWIYQPYSNSNHFTSCTHLCGDLLSIDTIYWALLWSSSSSQKPTYR